MLFKSENSLNAIVKGGLGIGLHNIDKTGYHNLKKRSYIINNYFLDFQKEIIKSFTSDGQYISNQSIAEFAILYAVSHELFSNYVDYNFTAFTDTFGLRVDFLNQIKSLENSYDKNIFKECEGDITTITTLRKEIDEKIVSLGPELKMNMWHYNEIYLKNSKDYKNKEFMAKSIGEYFSQPKVMELQKSINLYNNKLDSSLECLSVGVTISDDVDKDIYKDIADYRSIHQRIDDKYLIDVLNID